MFAGMSFYDAYYLDLEHNSLQHHLHEKLTSIDDSFWTRSNSFGRHKSLPPRRVSKDVVIITDNYCFKTYTSSL